jgi:competence ComEA-like helix-hairpin-helix protein
VEIDAKERSETMRNLDLNTASREDLMDIDGVSPTLADRIIQFRDERGGIDSVDDLRDVSGISPSVLKELRAASGESGAGEVMEIDEEEESEEW